MKSWRGGARVEWQFFVFRVQARPLPSSSLSQFQFHVYNDTSDTFTAVILLSDNQLGLKNIEKGDKQTSDQLGDKTRQRKKTFHQKRFASVWKNGRHEKLIPKKDIRSNTIEKINKLPLLKVANLRQIFFLRIKPSPDLTEKPRWWWWKTRPTLKELLIIWWKKSFLAGVR